MDQIIIRMCLHVCKILLHRSLQVLISLPRRLITLEDRKYPSIPKPVSPHSPLSYVYKIIVSNTHKEDALQCFSSHKELLRNPLKSQTQGQFFNQSLVCASFSHVILCLRIMIKSDRRPSSMESLPSVPQSEAWLTAFDINLTRHFHGPSNCECIISVDFNFIHFFF